MRKIISLVLCLVMLVAVFAACNKTEAPADTDTESKAPADAETDTEDTGDAAEGTPVGNGTLVLGSDPVEITYWIHVNDVDDVGEMEDQVWDDIVAKFEEKYPNVTINLEGIGKDANDSGSLLNTAAASNNLPELIYNADAHIDDWGEAGLILEYSEYLSDDFYSSYKESALETGNMYAPEEGQVWTAPCSYGLSGWVINTKILSDYDLEVPVTFDDLYNVIEVLDANGVLPIAHGAADVWAIWGYHEFVNQYGWTPEQCAQFETGEIGIEETAFYNAFQRIDDIAKAGAFADDVAVTTNDTAASLWITGQAGMYGIYEEWRNAKMQEYDSDPEAFAEYYDVLMNSVVRMGFEAEDDIFDDGVAHGIKMAIWGVQIGACAAEDEQKLAAAIAFIEFMVSEECADIYAESTMSIPLIWESDLDYDYTMWGLEQSYLEAHNTEGYFFHEPTDYFTIAFYDTYRNVATGLICGTMTLEDAITECNNWQTTAAAQLASEAE